MRTVSNRHLHISAHLLHDAPLLQAVCLRDTGREGQTKAQPERVQTENADRQETQGIL